MTDQDARAPQAADREHRAAACSVPVGRFPRSQRVRKRAEFREIQGKGRRVTTRNFVLLVYARVVTDGRPRLGVTASRRIGKAHVRNRAKRLVREAFRATRELWQPGIDVVVIVRKPLLTQHLAEVTEEWLSVAHLVGRRTRSALQDRQDWRSRATAKPTPANGGGAQPG